MNDITVTFLEDGAQAPADVAQALAAFIAAATTSVDIAVYDCALGDDTAQTVGSALNACAARGVAVRVAYYSGPPPRSPALATTPPGHPGGLLSVLTVPTKPVRGFQALMHDKYVIRDAASADAAVWTGSMNWTNDSWSREENIILQLPSTDLAALYTADFEDLWSTGDIANTGGNAGGTATLQYGGQPMAVQVWFSPDCGPDMAHAVARAISGAQQRIVVASPVLTDGVILGALANMLQKGLALSGIVDATQMAEVLRQWDQNHLAGWKIRAYETIAEAANFAGKRSTPYAPGSVHDYMHAKIMVIDDTIFTGSYNFSHSGEENAENLLRFDSPALADLCVQYITTLITRYGAGTAAVA